MGLRLSQDRRILAARTGCPFADGAFVTTTFAARAAVIAAGPCGPKAAIVANKGIVARGNRAACIAALPVSIVAFGLIRVVPAILASVIITGDIITRGTVPGGTVARSTVTGATLVAATLITGMIGRPLGLALGLAFSCSLATAIFTITPSIDRWLVESGEIGFHRKLIAIIGIVAGVPFTILAPTLVTAAAGFIQPHARIGDDAEIVIGKLEVILRRHAIAVKVGIMRKLAVFLQHLRRIAPRPAVNPVELLTAALRTPVIATAAPTVVVVTTVIVVQGSSLS